LATTKKSILNKLYFVLVISTFFWLAIIGTVANIQYVDGEKYRNLSEQLTLRNDTIFANRGNIFSSDGSLLATSTSQFEIRMDANTVASKVFKKEIRNLSVALSKMLGNTALYWERKIRKARNNNNRYVPKSLIFFEFFQ